MNPAHSDARSRVFVRDVEPDPGYEFLVIDPDGEVAIEPGTWTELVPVDDDARERAMYALCRFLFPGYCVPRSEMADAVLVALAGEGDWKAQLPAMRAAIGDGWKAAG